MSVNSHRLSFSFLRFFSPSHPLSLFDIFAFSFWDISANKQTAVHHEKKRARKKRKPSFRHLVFLLFVNNIVEQLFSFTQGHHLIITIGKRKKKILVLIFAFFFYLQGVEITTEICWPLLC